MPNAYVVCAVKEEKGAGGWGGGARRDEEDEEARPTTVTTTTAWGGTCEIITLKSGDRRRRNELADRAKRLRILRKYGLAPPDTSAGKGGKRFRAGGTERGGGDDYGDDGFEGEDDDSYGEDEFDRSEGGGGGRNSPGRERGGGGRVPCEASEWPMSNRIKGLKTLKRLSKANREAGELRQLLAEGVAPEPPKFWSAKPGHPDVGQDEDALTDELLLCWRPQRGSAVAFFSLEMSGPEGSKAFCQGAHREICRDPPDANGDPQYQFWVRGLCPSTRYGFRVRAFNGFGPGAYAHGCFATRPSRPQAPVAVKLAPNEVTLQWIFASRNAEKLRELRQVFDGLDEHDDGQIGRDEFLACLDLDHPHLMALLKAVALDPAAAEGGERGAMTAADRRRFSGGARDNSDGSGVAVGSAAARGVGTVTLSVFDAIEANNDEFICWDEIDIHFSHATSASDGVENGNGGRGGFAQTGRGATGGGHFVVEVCTSQEDDRWKEVWKGTIGTARVKMLEAGRSYRFRVRPANIEGLEGPASESVVVNTLLPTPSAPRINSASGKAATTITGVWDTRVRLRWDAVTGAGGSAAAPVGASGLISGGGGGGGRTGPATDRAATRILMQWAHECSNDHGVNVEAVFSQFDRHGSGVIDPLELGNLLEALGVEVTEERLREAFTEIGRGGDGIDGSLSLDDFEAWWGSDLAAKYALFRDDGVAGNLLEMEAVAAAARGSGSTSSGGGSGVSPTTASTTLPATSGAAARTTVASYKGRTNGCEVAGLSPNTLYHFRVRTVNTRTRSSLSPPLQVMTAPRRPEPPVIIRCEQRSIIAKWYPGSPGGAHKYRLQARLIEGLDGIEATHDNNNMTKLTEYNRASTAAAAGGGAVGRGSSFAGAGGRKRRAAWGAAGDGSGNGAGGGEWVTVYEGADSTAKITGLAANSVHHFRVRAVNLRGVASEWSFPAQAATSLRRPAAGSGSGGGGGGGWDDKVGNLLSRPHNAAEVFHVDADDDIVVGDTIIFTERLYVDRNGELLVPGGGAISSSSSSSNNILAASHRSHAFHHDFPAAASGAGYGAAPRVSLSMASLEYQTTKRGEGKGRGRGATSGRRPSTAASLVVPGAGGSSGGGGQFVGERTAAAHVLQDSFRSMRRKERGGVLEYDSTKSRGRLLRLEVIWSTVSREEAREFLLPRGSIIERSQGRLLQFETFRALWAQDERRKSVKEEWALLSGVL
eukprot:g14468.t2